MNLATSMHAELVNFVLFAACVGKMLLMTGLIVVVPAAVVDTLLLKPKTEADRGATHSS